MYLYGQSAHQISSEHAREVKAPEFFPTGLKALWVGLLGSDWKFLVVVKRRYLRDKGDK